MSLPSYTDPNLVPSRLDEPASLAYSVAALNAAWPEDLERLAAGLAARCSGVEYEVVAVANDSEAVAVAIERLAADDPRVRGISFTQHVGFGGGRNAAIVQSRGKVVVVADTSVEPAGDMLTPLGEALADPSVGLAGRWGLITDDLRHFHEETAGEVDAMQAYLMAFRREDARKVGLFDPKYKFYRNADIEYSMHWRAAGYRIVAVDLPAVRHEHREWDALTEDQRAKKSRDNFARFLRAWGDRTDLLTGRLAPGTHAD